jgi:hypothetical protein
MERAMKFPTVAKIDLDELHGQLRRLRGDLEVVPDASIVIPVNAQGDAYAALVTLFDIVQYKGPYKIELVLVINNYQIDAPPAEIEQFRSLGVQIVATPNARRPGEVVIISARALGARAAKSEVLIHFDADCRIPDIDALLNWYIEMLNSGYQLAYSQVCFYEMPNRAVVKLKLAIHYSSRWIKRNLFGIPTTRGSNYAITRSIFLKCYDAGNLSVDLQVGPAAKLVGAHIIYSGRSEFAVFTSARRMTGRWNRLFPHYFNRLRYNLKAIPMRWRDVSRTSWRGFDKESENREKLILPAKKTKH